MAKIAFIGLGNMGVPMAANLVKAGHEVRGFDIAQAGCANARQAGVSTSGSAEEAVSGAEAIITMLPAGEHVLAVWQDIVGRAEVGALMIDCSTIDVDSARRAHELAAARALAAVDAPVSGGIAGAKAASLTFMAGGAPEAIARARPLLAAMGKRTVECGAPGMGQAAKICNNMILGISMIAVGEAFVLAERLGLSHKALFEVASTSSGQCWSLTSYCPVPGLVPGTPAENDYRPGFAAALMLKDLKLAQGAALSANAATPLGAEAAQIYALFAALGHGGEDFSAILKLLRGGSGKASS